MELFLDLWGNCMIRQRTNTYLQSIVQDLIQFITEDTRSKSVLKDLVIVDGLTFKQRDSIEDVFSSYCENHPFDIEKDRDTRLRRHFKERYDFRKNLTDWDYQFGGLRDFGPFINRRDYKDWRLTGTAFELRLAENNKPNRTMASFVYGKDVSIFVNLNPTFQKKSRDSIEVRGFWGDVLQSPYIPFGIEIWEEPEKTKFMKEVNKQ